MRTLLDLAFAEPLPEAPAPAAPPRGKNLLDLAFESPPGGAGSQSRTLLDAAFESPGIGTAAAPPGWSESDRAKAAELDRRAAEIKATMTPGQTADQIYGSLMQGIFDVPASALKAIGTADEYLRKKVGSWTTDEQATTAAGKAIEDFSREVFKTNPDLQNDFWLSKLPGMIGTLASFIVPATEMKFAVEGRAVGRAGAPITEIAKAAAARGAVAGTRAATGIGAMTMAQGQFAAAKAAGADDDTAMKAYVGGLGIGATMAIPLHRWLSRINEGTNGGYAKVLKEVGTDGAVNFGVGFLQTTAGNAIAKELYDADRDILDNAVESGAVFSVAGLPFSLLSSAIRNAAAPGAKPPAPGPEAPPAPLPEIPTPPTKAPAPDIAAAVENLSKAVGALKATVAPQVPQEPPVEALKAAGTTLYHGTKADYADADIVTGRRMYGIHLTTDEGLAKVYGKVKKYGLAQDAKVLDLSDGEALWEFMKKEGIVDAEGNAIVETKNGFTLGRTAQSGKETRDETQSKSPSSDLGRVDPGQG